MVGALELSIGLAHVDACELLAVFFADVGRSADVGQGTNVSVLQQLFGQGPDPHRHGEPELEALYDVDRVIDLVVAGQHAVVRGGPIEVLVASHVAAVLVSDLALYSGADHVVLFVGLEDAMLAQLRPSVGIGLEQLPQAESVRLQAAFHGFTAIGGPRLQVKIIQLR